MDFDEQERRAAEGLVPCDDVSCQAKGEPNRRSLTELRAALEHWEGHRYLAGCSHAR